MEPESLSRPWSIMATVAGLRSTQLFSAGLLAAGLSEELRQPGPYTLFAPTDAALAGDPGQILDDGLDSSSKPRLLALLRHHILPLEIHSNSGPSLYTARTMQGTSLKLRFIGGAMQVEKTIVVVADINCSNGVIHLIDGLLGPVNAGGFPAGLNESGASLAP